MKAVIFAGGVGSRLWPLSRENTPKQFEPISEGKSTLQLTVDRLVAEITPEDIYISTNVKFKEVIQKQLPQIPADNIICEPARRDVGPAVGLAVTHLFHLFPNETMAILWGDHLIQSPEIFRQMLSAGDEVVQKNEDKIVFLGQVPRYPNPNIGWIGYKGIHSTANDLPVFSFVDFKYKPEIEKVRKYTKDGFHSWNMGYFIAKTKTLASFIEQHSGEMWSSLEQIGNAYGTSDYQVTLDTVYPLLPAISFDHAVLEHLKPSQCLVISADIGWSDVGSWESLKESLEQSSADNVTMGLVKLYDSQNSLVYSSNPNKLIVGIDLDDIVVVDTDDALFIAPKSSANKVKNAISEIKGTDLKKYA